MRLWRAGLCILPAARAAARLEVVFVEHTCGDELARCTGGDEFAVDAGAGCVLSDVGDTAAPHFDAAELLGLEFFELLVDLVDAGLLVLGDGCLRHHGDGGGFGGLGLDLLDDLVAAEGDDGYADCDAAGDHELRAEEEGGDGGKTAFEGEEDARAHFAGDGADFGKGEGHGGEGLGVLLEVLDHGRDRVLQAVGLVEKKGDFRGFVFQLSIIVLGYRQWWRNVAVCEIHIDKGLRV